MMEHDYIYVGSFEKRWCWHNRDYKIETDSCLVAVHYNSMLDGILEEQLMFDEENDEGLTVRHKFVIGDFDKLLDRYTEFILNNINLLRG